MIMDMIGKNRLAWMIVAACLGPLLSTNWVIVDNYLHPTSLGFITY